LLKQVQIGSMLKHRLKEWIKILFSIDESPFL
jgi:hypothetical protein